MTATLPGRRQTGPRFLHRGALAWLRRTARNRRRATPVRLPPSHTNKAISLGLAMVSVILFGQIINIVIISQVQHSTTQTRLFEELRTGLAEGSAPLGQTDHTGALVAPGTPLALLSIPALDIQETVVEGTTSRELMDGVGHRRDTPLPGQSGTSVLMGRAAAYGGPLGQLTRLAPGERFTVTTGLGVAEFEVMGHRRAGDPGPSIPTGDEGRLTLTTAAGAAFLPDGVLRVDAKLLSKAFPKTAPVLYPASLEAAELPLGSDTSDLVGLLVCLELLILAAMAAVWSWYRWGQRETWLVFLPMLGALSVLTGTQVSLLLPNLL
ncbi:sortase [Pseudarthrobacter cellobiosi]|uniref:sortase n=1 Tax=Pseudarthrobacter cellobiosi TaxID=2953654 RepID=UPI00208DF06E|nr:sortase [Pseudarthrobacter sp. HLT1-5]MCO4256943.1 sortase [Pseudarthrobacter sp. HLT1-5]